MHVPPCQVAEYFFRPVLLSAHLSAVYIYYKRSSKETPGAPLLPGARCQMESVRRRSPIAVACVHKCGWLLSADPGHNVEGRTSRVGTSARDGHMYGSIVSSESSHSPVRCRSRHAMHAAQNCTTARSLPVAVPAAPAAGSRASTESKQVPAQRCSTRSSAGFLSQLHAVHARSDPVPPISAGLPARLRPRLVELEIFFKKIITIYI